MRLRPPKPAVRKDAQVRTRRDQIGNAGARLRERLGLDIHKELLRKVLHLQDTNAHDSGLGVVTPAKTIAEASANGHNVLQGTTQADTGHVLNKTHAEVGRVEQLVPDLRGLATAGPVADRGLREFVTGHLVGDVGTAQRRARNIERVLDDVGNDANLALVHIHALDHGDGLRIRRQVSLEGLADIEDELGQPSTRNEPGAAARR